MLDSNPELAAQVKQKQQERAAAAAAETAKRRAKAGIHPICTSTVKPEYNTIGKCEYVINHKGKPYVFTGSIVVTKKGTSSVSLTNERKPSYVPGDITTDCDDMLTQAVLKAQAAVHVKKYLQKQWDKLAAKHVYVAKPSKA
jgi:hypothetical protein